MTKQEIIKQNSILAIVIVLASGFTGYYIGKHEKADLVSKIAHLADSCKESDPSAAIVLYTLSGALRTGTEKELATTVREFAVEQKAILEESRISQD